jgi:hypothetical protein
MKNILTIFAGRKKNLEVLLCYLKKALELKILDEIHLWNYTRNKEDEAYIKTITNLKKSSGNGTGTYIQIFTPIQNNSFQFDVVASNIVHIQITDELGNSYEIVLGEHNTTNSVIRKNMIEIYSVSALDPTINTVHIKVSITDTHLIVYKNMIEYMNCKIDSSFHIKDIFLKTGHGCSGEFIYETIQNDKLYFMDPCVLNDNSTTMNTNKYKSYYMYYNNEIFKDDIIIKCDDDIVFIDLQKLPNFINFTRNNNYDLVFANIINNGVSAYFQQNKYNLIPKDVMELEYPENGLNGSLWESGKKAELLHRYFIDNYKTFLEYDYNNDIVPISTRFSINFFATKGKNWYKYTNSYVDDEYNLTVHFVKEYGYKNILYSDFYVSHLHFYKQIETGIDIDSLLSKYYALYLSITNV